MKRFLLSVLMLASSSSLFAQWQQCPGQPFPPFGGLNASRFLSVGNDLWVSIGNAVLVTSDNGNTWTKIDQTQGLYTGISGISALQKVGNKIFASISGNGNSNVYSTTDFGQSWRLDTAGWPGIFLPGVPRLAMVAMWNLNDQAVIGTLESNFTLYQLPTDTMWRVMTVPDAFRTSATFVIGDTLYKANTNKIIYTTNFGNTWTERTFSIPGTFYQTGFTPAADGRLYCVQIHTPSFKPQIFVSNNFGHTWDSINYRIPFGLDILRIYADDKGIMLATTGFDTTKKALSSTDGGNTWFDMSKGLSHLVQFHFQNFSGFHKHNGVYFTGYADGGVFRAFNFVSSVADKRVESVGHIFPNPASSHLNIPSTEAIESVLIYDLHGKLVRSYSTQIQYDLEGLEAGMYLVQTKTKKGIDQQLIQVQP